MRSRPLVILLVLLLTAQSFADPAERRPTLFDPARHMAVSEVRAGRSQRILRRREVGQLPDIATHNNERVRARRRDRRLSREREFR